MKVSFLLVSAFLAVASGHYVDEEPRRSFPLLGSVTFCDVIIASHLVIAAISFSLIQVVMRNLQWKIM